MYLFLLLYPAGRTCSENVNDCWSQPCLNGGSCMDLINDYICHCPLGKYQVLVYYWACLQKYHAINFLWTAPWEYMKRLFLIHLHANLFVYFDHFSSFVQDVLPKIAKTGIISYPGLLKVWMQARNPLKLESKKALHEQIEVINLYYGLGLINN